MKPACPEVKSPAGASSATLSLWFRMRRRRWRRECIHHEVSQHMEAGVCPTGAPKGARFPTPGGIFTMKPLAFTVALFICLSSLLLLAPAARGQDAGVPKPRPNSAEEPMAQKLSLTKSAEFLDSMNLWWTAEKKCGTCHTNYPYLMARPALKEVPLTTGHDEVRKFFET